MRAGSCWMQVCPRSWSISSGGGIPAEIQTRLKKRINMDPWTRLIEQLRVQSRIPHRLTWIEFDMVAAAIRAHGMGLAQSRDGRHWRYCGSPITIKPRRQGWLLSRTSRPNDCSFPMPSSIRWKKTGRVICTPFSFTWVTG